MIERDPVNSELVMRMSSDRQRQHFKVFRDRLKAARLVGYRHSGQRLILDKAALRSVRSFEDGELWLYFADHESAKPRGAER